MSPHPTPPQTCRQLHRSMLYPCELHIFICCVDFLCCAVCFIWLTFIWNTGKCNRRNGKYKICLHFFSGIYITPALYTFTSFKFYLSLGNLLSFLSIMGYQGLLGCVHVFCCCFFCFCFSRNCMSDFVIRYLCHLHADI